MSGARLRSRPSTFKYYGEPLSDGVDAASLLVLVTAGALLAAAGPWALERRDVT